MKRGHRRSIKVWIYAGSIAAHLSLWAVIALLPARERSTVVAINFGTEKKKKTEPPKPPPPLREARPKPPPRAIAQPQAKAPDEPARETPRHPQAGPDGFTDLGGVPVRADGGVAPDAGASPAGSGARPAAAPKAISHRTKQLEAAPQDACAEPIVKPKVRTPGQITYTKEGQEAEIEGAVRVEVTVDETGKVIGARVLTGLGYGLDERALSAANETVFEPATLCGNPVVATKVLAFNFELR